MDILAVLFFFSVPLGSQITAIVHLVRALFRRNNTASRFLLLGLVPSICGLAMLAYPGPTGEWFIALRLDQPRPDLIWLIRFLMETVYLWTHLIALIVFGAELLSGHRLGRWTVRCTVALAYVGVANATYYFWFQAFR